MSRVRIIRSVIAAAAVLSLMAVAPGPALADKNSFCRQSGSRNTNCTIFGGLTFAVIKIEKQSRLLTVKEINIILLNQEKMKQKGECNQAGLINVQVCESFVKRNVETALASFGVTYETLNVKVEECKTECS